VESFGFNSPADGEVVVPSFFTWSNLHSTYLSKLSTEEKNDSKKNVSRKTLTKYLHQLYPKIRR